MNGHHPPKIVVLGMLGRHPVAGMVWLTMQHLVGLRLLGYDAYYVEAHGALPKPFIRDAGDDGTPGAAAFIAKTMRRFDLGGRWCYHALHSNGRCYGMSESELKALYRSAALIVNLHGGTTPLPEHVATNRLVYLGTDPVNREIELYQNSQETIDLLTAHCAHFTWGENYGSPDCKVPVSERFHFVPTRQPVVLDFWQTQASGAGPAFTTVGSWRQLWREIRFQGEVYHWSKHFEFLKFIDLPAHTEQPFELALWGYGEEDRRLLDRKGWRVRDAVGLSADVADYRQYIVRSRGEFTVAKDQNVRLRSGWFSDRSATYLAAGRPVITQETGFSNILPTGDGLFGFSTLAEIVTAVEAIKADYARHSRAAYEIARDYFSHDVVLPRMLEEVGLP